MKKCAKEVARQLELRNQGKEDEVDISGACRGFTLDCIGQITCSVDMQVTMTDSSVGD